MVAGEHAEAARVDRQALVEAELHREVRDEEVVRQALLMPPGRALGLGLEPLLHAPELDRVLGREHAAEVLVGQLGEERRRVVAELPEPPRLEIGEQRPGAGGPAEGEVAGDLCKRSPKRPPVANLVHHAGAHLTEPHLGTLQTPGEL